MRRKSKVDRNQQIIVEALRTIGASVAITSSVGDGFPDLVVGYRDRTILIEVKTRTGRLTPSQLVFAARWRGELYLCRDLEDVAIALGLPRAYFEQWPMRTI